MTEINRKQIQILVTSRVARAFARLDFLLLEKVLHERTCLKREMSECQMLRQEMKCAEMETRGSAPMVELL